MAGAFGAGVQIDYLQLTRVREGLSVFAPQCLTVVNDRLRRAGRTVTEEASADVEAHATTHRAHDTAAGYKVQVRAKGVRLVNATQGGAILELAANPQCQQGRSLVSTLNERYGQPGRILWAAWDRNAERVNAEVAGTVAEAERALQAVIDGARVSV